MLLEGCRVMLDRLCPTPRLEASAVGLGEEIFWWVKAYVFLELGRTAVSLDGVKCGGICEEEGKRERSRY